MNNLKMEIKGNKLTIEVPDLTAEGKTSSTGKSRIVAGTSGYVTLDHASGAKVMVNVITPTKG